MIIGLDTVFSFLLSINSIRTVRSENKLERKKCWKEIGGTELKERTPLHKNPARREFLWKERSEKKFDINPRDRVIAREQSASRGQAEKVVGAAGRSVRT